MTKEYDELKKDVYKEYLKKIETFKSNPLLKEIFNNEEELKWMNNGGNLESVRTVILWWHQANFMLINMSMLKYVMMMDYVIDVLGRNRNES